MKEQRKKQPDSQQDDWFMITAEHKASSAQQEGSAWVCLPSEIDRIKQEKLASGFRIWIDPTREDFEKCLAGGNGFIVDFWLHMPRVKDWAEKHHQPLEKYVDRMADTLLDLMDRYGNRVWWCLYGEHDNHIPLTHKFGSRKEVYDYMQALTTTSLGMKSNIRFPGSVGANGKIAYNGMPQPFEYLKKRGIDPHKANIAIQCVLGTYSHYFYEKGIRMAWMEVNVGKNIQVELAFLRGAARQYQAYWGVDMSSWYSLPMIFTTVYDRDGNLVSGTPANRWLREMLTCFLSGANLIHQEMTEISFWVDKKLGDAVVRFGHDAGKPEEWFDGIAKVDVSKYINSSNPEWYDLGERELELSPTGRVSQQMVDFAERHPELRRHSCRPVGLVLEFYHGWTQEEAFYNKVWYGNDSYDSGDFMVKGFFAAAFPGHLKWGDGWARLWADGILPSTYGDRVNYNFSGSRALSRSGFDFRPYDTGELVSGRWGDVFDVLLENCGADVLAQYPLLALLGRIIPGRELEQRLLEYVRQGGTLFVSTQNLNETFMKSAGFSIVARHQCHTSECLCCGARFVEKLFKLDELKGAGFRKTAQTFDGRPVIMEKRIGKGNLAVSLVPYGMSGDNSGLLEIVKHLLDHRIDAVMPVQVTGGPVQLLVNTPPGAVAATLINNTGEIWRGSVLFRKSGGRSAAVRDLWTDQDVPAERLDGNLQVEVSIEPFGFRVLCAG